MASNKTPPVPPRLLQSFIKGGENEADVRELRNYLTFLRDSLDEYQTLSYAGNPENNVTANKSHLCVDTTNDFLYYNFTVGATTGWTKIVV